MKDAEKTVKLLDRKMDKQHSALNDWALKVYELEEIPRQIGRLKAYADSMNNRLDELADRVSELEDTIHSIKKTLKQFISLPDEQSQADFDREIDRA